MRFTQEIHIRFADVDAAGIVYYPNFFHYYHSAFEEFFGKCHGSPYSEWINEKRIGFPTVHVDADYYSPLCYGDNLQIEVSISKIGKRSIDFRFKAFTKPDTCVASAIVTKVCACMDSRESINFPADLQEVLEKYHEVE